MYFCIHHEIYRRDSEHLQSDPAHSNPTCQAAEKAMIRVHGCEPDFIQDGGDDMRAFSSRLLLAFPPVPCLASPFTPPQYLLDW
jgi:hypothetical protein